MATGDLEFLERVFLKVRRTRSFTRSFAVIRGARHHRAVNTSSNIVSVGTKSKVSDPPGT